MKILIKHSVPLVLLASLSSIAQAAIFNWTGTQAIPDNDASGVSFSFTVSDPAVSMADVSVTLDISGGFNGDLYAYLSHGAGFAVLLNRVGRTAANELGYSNPGSAVTVSGSAPTDLHLYQANSPSYNGNGQLTGLWAADGREVDPHSSGAAFDAATRDATLSVFNGLNPNGDWTLFFADASAGGISTLNSLSVEITAVPEPPVSAWLGMFAAVALLVQGGRAWRARGHGRKASGHQGEQPEAAIPLVGELRLDTASASAPSTACLERMKRR